MTDLVLILGSWQTEQPFPQLCPSGLLTGTLLPQAANAARSGTRVVQPQLIPERRAHGGRARPLPPTCMFVPPASKLLQRCSSSVGGLETLSRSFKATSDVLAHDETHVSAQQCLLQV